MAEAMTSKETRWIVIFSLLIIFLTSLPYWIGFANQGTDWQFSGFVFGVEDGNSYIAKMRIGQIGDWLFRTPYSMQAQNGVLAFLPYMLLGKLVGGSETHLQFVLLFHFFRIVAIPIGIFAIYRFTSLFIAETWWRQWTTVMATVAGGLGWLVLTFGGGEWLGSLPLEFISPETFGFLSIYGLPHLIISRALLIFGLIQYLKAPDRPSSAWWAGCFFLLIGFFQPLSILSAYAAIGAHLVVIILRSMFNGFDRELLMKWGGAAIRAMVVPLPLLAYFALTFSQDPFLVAWTRQNRILSPHPLHYILSYALVLIPAAYGGYVSIKRRSARALFPVSWALIIFALAYFPHNLQRRLPEGTWVAFSTLSAIGLMEGIRSSRAKRIVGGVVLGFSLVSSILLLFGGVQVSVDPSPPVYRPSTEIKAFEWVEEQIAPGRVVLSSYDIGNALPAYAPVRVVIGHGPESIDLDRLRGEVSRFYGDMSVAERATFLDQNEVGLVFYGPEERRLGGWDPSASRLLDLKTTIGEYQVFEVMGR